MPTSSSRSVPPELAALAEEPDAHTIAPPGFRKLIEPRFAILLGSVPHFTSVQRLRLRPGAVEAAVADVRTIARAHGHTNAVWWIGGRTTPPDLHERLEALGFVPPTRGGSPALVALATAAPPEPGPAGVEARPARSLEEFAAAHELRYEAFGTPEPRREAERARLAELYEQTHASGIAPTFVAFVDGRLAGSAVGVFAPQGCLLVGGATAAWARGQGAYRALVRARWDEAARRGTPGLAVAAAPTSEPVLRRLGFVEVTRLRRLEDPAT